MFVDGWGKTAYTELGDSLKKNIDLDDLRDSATGKGISEEVIVQIHKVMREAEKRNGFLISDAVFRSIQTEDGNIVLMQIEPFSQGRIAGIRLVLNSDAFSSQTIDALNTRIARSSTTVAQNLVEAVIHESGHAKLISGKSVTEIKALYDELEPLGISGISKIASLDGAEAIAEIEVLMYRGESISFEAHEHYDKYVRVVK